MEVGGEAGRETERMTGKAEGQGEDFVVVSMVTFPVECAPVP